MPILSILIPVDQPGQDPARLLARLALHKADDVEIIVAARADSIERLSLEETCRLDGRIRLVPTEASSPSALWAAAYQASGGTWVSLVRPNDSLDGELATIIRFIEARAPDTDGFAWNALQILPDAVPGQAGSVAIPTGYAIVDFDKTDMLKAFFLWEGSHNIPKMPFGLYHAALNRRLAQTVFDTMVAAGRNPELPQWEWAARTVLLGAKFAFCPRPLSIVEGVRPEAPREGRPAGTFPLHAGIGTTAAIAEIQNAVFEEMGAAWVGMEENFIRACMIDCMLEADQARFDRRATLYAQALGQWQGGRFAGLFRPQFSADRQPDRRRGLQGSALMIDRHIAGARTAPEFYDVIRHFLAPVGVICGATTI